MNTLKAVMRFWIVRWPCTSLKRLVIRTTLSLQLAALAVAQHLCNQAKGQVTVLA